MPELVAGLTHQDAQNKDDAALKKEARAYLEQSSGAQLVAEILTKLRAAALPWWSPETLRARWSATDRMRWYRQRPDLRQDITTSLTGLAPRAARKKDPDFQAGLLDSVIDDGDIDVAKFEDAFDPTDLAVYGNSGEVWRHLCEQWPWDDDDQFQQDLAAWLLRALIADRCLLHGIARRPVLSAWDVRMAIDGRVWHARMPLEIRVAIDDARLRQEKERPNEPFHAKGDLGIAVPELIAASVPLRDLLPVFDAAASALGFVRKPPAPEPPAKQVGAPPSPASSSDAVAKTIPNPPSGAPGPSHAGLSAGPPHTPSGGPPGPTSPSPKGDGRAQVPAVRAAIDPQAGVHRSAPPPASVRPPASSAGAAGPPPSAGPAASPSVRPGSVVPPGSVRPPSPSTAPSPPARQGTVPGMPAPVASVAPPQSVRPAAGAAPAAGAVKPSKSQAPLSGATGVDSSDVPTPFTGVPEVRIPAAPPGSEENVEDLENTNPWIVATGELWGDGEAPVVAPEASPSDTATNPTYPKFDPGSPSSKRRRPK